jgi:hypothetical protein
MRLLRSGRQNSDRAALLPLRHGLLVDAVAPRQSPQALLTMLYRFDGSPLSLGSGFTRPRAGSVALPW